jgi:hypothetical protein
MAQQEPVQIIETHHMVDDLTFQEILASIFNLPAPAPVMMEDILV